MEFEWVDGFEIKVRIEDGAAVISANREGLLSLAKHLKTLAESEKRPEDLPELPEDINDETLAAVLKDINRAHAEAVKTLHEHEEMLEQVRKSEKQLRTLLIAMERLTKGRKLPEVDI